MPSAESPRRRSDAERNRGLILVAAREVLADRAAEGSRPRSPDELESAWPPSTATSRGAASCWRRCTRRKSTSCARPAAQTSGPPGDALIGWLRRFLAFHRSKHPIAAELLRHTDAADPVFGSSRDRVLAAGRPLLDAAQQAHEVRADLALDQVIDLVLAAAAIPGSPDYVGPILQAALDGLRI